MPIAPPSPPAQAERPISAARSTAPPLDEASRSGPAGDRELLTQFVRCRDPVAFEGLVRRHGPMVLGACRRLLRNPHDAEDAFQATFLVLLRKAETVNPRERVGNWLYGVACRTAAKAKSMNAKRHVREHQAEPPPSLMPPSATGSDAAAQAELRSVIDDELARLPERYRAAVVMCELNGISRAEAAEALRLPEGTLSSRLSRAREMLRTRLARRGMMLSAAAVATAGLSAETMAAPVPPALLASTLSATGVGTTAAAAVVPAGVAALADGVVKAMLLAKLKLAAMVLVSVAVVGTGVGLAVHHAMVANAALPRHAAASAGPAVPGAPLGASPIAPSSAAPATPAAPPPNVLPSPDLTSGKPEARGPTIQANVLQLNRTARTISVTYSEASRKDRATFPLASDLRVSLTDYRAKSTQPAELSDVAEGSAVVIQLSPDRAVVTEIVILSGSLTGMVQTLNLSTRTLTLSTRQKPESAAVTFVVWEDAKITIVGRTKTDMKAAQFAQLVPGTPITVQVAADRSMVTAITVLAASLGGTVRSVDAGARSFSIATKDAAGVGERTLTIPADANITVVEGSGERPGVWADIIPGMTAHIQTVPLDPEIVASMRLTKPADEGKTKKGEE